MKFSVAPLLEPKGKSTPFSCTCSGAELDKELEAFRDSQIMVSGEIRGQGLYLEVSGQVRTEGRYVCSRCLAEAVYSYQIPLDEVFAEASVPAHNLPAGREIQAFVSGELDLQPLVRELLLLEEPTSPLCMETCKGLCGKCGQNLNEGDCGCDRRQVDPRLASLQNWWEQKQK